jgi:tetratricopeptide (TPR) repeat protein
MKYVQGRSPVCSIRILILCFPVLCATAVAQSGAGEVSFSNSGAKAAQEPFLYGLAQLHNFEYDSAAQAFRKAEAIDPDFAIAYWGEAMTFNHGVWNQQDRPSALAALKRLGPTPDARLAKAPTDREKAYLRSIEILYGAGTTGEGAKPSRDLAYADAMEQLHAKYPDDIDAAAFYALALLGTAEGVRDERIYMRAAAILIPLFYKNPHHPGLAHYLIHSCDDPIHAPLALPAAEAYSRIAPEAGHAQHMTSHIFLALGMWEDVVRANEAAVAVVNRNRATEGKAPGHCGHYSYWLEYGYLETGQADKAKRVVEGCREQAAQAGQAARARDVIDPDDASLMSFIQMQTRYTIDTADWNGEVGGFAIDPGDSPFAQFNQAYGSAFSAAQRGDAAAAKKWQAAMDAALPRVKELLERQAIPANDPNRLAVEIEREQVEAAILESAGDLAQAASVAGKAATQEKELPYAFGPPHPEKPSYELLGEILLKQGQPAEAEAAFREALERAPNRTQTKVLLQRASAAAPGTVHNRP